MIKAIDAGDKVAAEGAFKSAALLLDSMATKGLIHKNKAARHKSRLNAKIRALKLRSVWRKPADGRFLLAS